MSAALAPEPLADAPPAAATPVPTGLRLRLDADTRVLDGGRVLLGGSPLRLLRLHPKAVPILAEWTAGRPVSDAPAEGRLGRRLVDAGVLQPVQRPSPPPDDVTVVVPVYNRVALLGPLLERLAPLRTVVVDDGSPEPGPIAVAAREGGAEHVRLARNLGPSAARNAGLARVRTAVVAFVDSDCLPPPGWLDPLRPHLDDPMVAAVAPRVVAPPGDGWLDRYEAARPPLDRGDRPGLVRPGTRLPFVPSAALVARRSALGRRPFDERLRGGEDVDLVWRLAAAGWHVRYEPAGVVVHRRTGGARSAFGRRYFYGTTAGPLDRRHPGALAPVALSGWTAAAWLLAARGRPLSAAATLGVAAAVLGRRLGGVVVHPWAEAARIVGGGSARALLPAAESIGRAFGPAAVLALAGRPTRVPAALLLTVPALARWGRTRPPLDPARYLAASLADDLAYGAGVWAGCLEARALGPLIPRVALSSPVWSRDALAGPAGGAPPPSS